MSAQSAFVLAAGLLPLVGAIVNLLLPERRPGLLRRVALVAAGASLACAAAACISVIIQIASTPMPISVDPLQPALGIDGLSAAFFGLNALIGLVSVMFSRVVDEPRAYFCTLGLAQAGTAGAFASGTTVGFWYSWLITVLCLCLLIRRWGRRSRGVRPLHTIVPVVLVVVAMGAAFAIVFSQTGAVRFSAEAYSQMPRAIQALVYALLLAAFGATVGILPLHFWLPRVHEQMHAAAGLLLDGSLFCLGAYGLVRVAPMFAPLGFELFRVPLAVLSSVTVLHAGIAILAQRNMRRMTAYCTIAYAGLIGLCVSTGSVAGGVAAVLLALGHTASSSLLITMNQLLHTRFQTLDMRDIGGLAKAFPVIAVLLCLAAAGICGLPALGPLAGILLGSASVVAAGLHPALLLPAAVGLACMACSLLRMLSMVVGGKPTQPVLAYARHRAEDPFDVIVAGQHVPVGVYEPPEEEAVHPRVFTGDLEGLIEFELSDEAKAKAQAAGDKPKRRPAVIHIDELRKDHAPLSAKALASRGAVQELPQIADLMGLASLPIACDANLSWDERVSASQDEWDEALEAWGFGEASRDIWDDADDKRLSDLLSEVEKLDAADEDAKEDGLARVGGARAGAGAAARAREATSAVAGLERLCRVCDERSVIVQRAPRGEMRDAGRVAVATAEGDAQRGFSGDGAAANGAAAAVGAAVTVAAGEGATVAGGESPGEGAMHLSGIEAESAVQSMESERFRSMMMEGLSGLGDASSISRGSGDAGAGGERRGSGDAGAGGERRGSGDVDAERTGFALFCGLGKRRGGAAPVRLSLVPRVTDEIPESDLKYDYSKDPSFRRSTLSRSDLAACLALVVTMACISLTSGLLASVAMPVLQAFLA